MTLNIENWKMTYKEHQSLSCKIPCSMYSVLFEHGIIKDPFYGLNELELTSFSDEGCFFESEFEADNDLLKKEYVELEFHGLDTLCCIYLNGTHIGSVKNMHRTYVFDIRDYIVPGTNKLKLDFSSPTEYFKKMNNKHYLYTNGNTIAGAAHLRKALYMSGWDWGPCLPDMGIFRPVVLEAYDGDKILDVYAVQTHKNNKVILGIEVETAHSKNCNLYAEIDGKEILLKDGKGKIEIENPKLWWVRGYGEQFLYPLTVKMVKNSEILDVKTQKIGLRTLTVSTMPDKTGSEFCFVLNGIKIFSMGANYIPQDNLLSRISPNRTKKLIEAATDANFNTLRIWGGGYYPEDEFYDLCDEYGIMVWQDFMVACCNVWLNEDMKAEFTAEAVYNVKRFRSHASLAILCGNNEMEEAVVNWGIGNSQLVREDYIELYERMLPEICQKYAPETFYWPASPSSGGGFDDPTCETRGDVHFWKVWHGGLPFTEYRKHNFRFCSEYGFEAYPSIKTIKSFCEEKDTNCFSRVMENHQKCRGGNKKILMYLADNYLYPTSFETLVYASQLLQADAIKYGVEHFRRCRPYCMGSIYWQFNDCWPVASWSSIDYFGRYKALHYAAKKFYAPVAMGLLLEKNNLIVNIANETMDNFEGEVRIFHSDAEFNVIRSYTKEISVNPLSSTDVFSKEFTPGNIYTEYLYSELYDKHGNFVMRQTELFVPPKHFEWKKPNIKAEISVSGNKTVIDISSDTFAKGVYIDFDDIDCILSDNFFDLTDKKCYRVTVETEHTPHKLKKQMKIMSVFDIGK